MKIVDKRRKNDTFKSLEAGDIFSFSDNIWMKLCDEWTDQAVRLSDGFVSYIEPETKTQEAYGEFVIKGK